MSSSTSSSSTLASTSLGSGPWSPSSRLRCLSFASFDIESASRRVGRRRYGSIDDPPKFEQRRPIDPRIGHDPHLPSRWIRHPSRQESQRPITLLHDIGTLASEAVGADNAQTLAMPRMEAIVNGDLKEMSMGSM